jgi:hypothetical protein
MQVLLLASIVFEGNPPSKLEEYSSYNDNCCKYDLAFNCKVEQSQAIIQLLESDFLL